MSTKPQHYINMSFIRVADLLSPLLKIITTGKIEFHHVTEEITKKKLLLVRWLGCLEIQRESHLYSTQAKQIRYPVKR